MQKVLHLRVFIKIAAIMFPSVLCAFQILHLDFSFLFYKELERVPYPVPGVAIGEGIQNNAKKSF